MDLQLLLVASILFSLSKAVVQDPLFPLPEPLPPYRNAIPIFNVIHSSMRQWGSSLNHNGVSFFPALVPKGTDFYHGTSQQEPVEGIEWLAFEPEHAQVFARGRMGRPPGGGKRRPRPPPPQQNLGIEEREDEPRSGYLHTYVTKKDLHLLYIDGMSAGKTDNGTLDSQDYLLLKRDAIEQKQMWGDSERAEGLCNISRHAWDGRVDGFLRMEAGFEIILCDFKKNLDVRRINSAYGECVDCKGPNPGAETGSGAFNYLRAVTDRYHGIGGGRVRLNYDNFVTAYSANFDLLESGERGPRLKHVPENILSGIRTQVDEMVMSEPNPFASMPQTIDWQAVTDMIVTHYSSRFKYMLMPAIINEEQRLNYELDRLLSPYIDYSNRSQEAELSRCSTHYIPSNAKPSLAATIVSDISRHICWLLSVTQMKGSTIPKRRIVEQLGRTLNWTTWKECGTCAYDEICSIPIWPYGSEEDWERPTCTNSSRMQEQWGYWGDRRGPGQRPPP